MLSMGDSCDTCGILRQAPGAARAFRVLQEGSHALCCPTRAGTPHRGAASRGASRVEWGVRCSPGMRIAPTLLWLLPVLALVGCKTGERYRYAATNIAPAPERALERVQWPEALQAACSDHPVEGILLREPYVQSTRPDSTEILWRSDPTVGAADEQVRFWPASDPDASEVAIAFSGTG